ncbi:PLGG1 [Symbiodinium pilosum]|uniref:PLGG1 protein n=1 Tax=Symbiodinium pilosum TaxID=2952 RepID=A0A812TFG4_SYMPI|nr:PLGG1 [Symbiodinium pilosum]
MADRKGNVRGVVGAAAAIVLVSRIRDVRHLPRLLLDKGSPAQSLHVLASSLAIFGYERLVAMILRRLGMTRMPSTLAAMLSLFAGLRTVQKLKDRATSDRFADLLKPGVDFLGKWMGLFLAPPLVSLDASIARLPPYSGKVWANTSALLGIGWGATHAAAAAVATSLVPQRQAPTSSKPAAATAKQEANGNKEVSLDEAVRRSWVLLGAAGFLGVACSPALPVVLHRPFGMLCEMSTTVCSFALSKLLPDAVQRVLHPLVICAVSSNLASRFVGPTAPYFDEGRGVGDKLFQWLPAAVTGLGVRMYNTTGLWLDNAEDFKCVLATCSASGCFSIFLTTLGAVNPKSPLTVPAPLSLPLLHRSVMSALGIEGSQAIGPECDPKLAVASILITGCIGASLGNALLEAFPAFFRSSSPLVRGVAMGCSAHSIGTAGLISLGDTEAAAISGASMLGAQKGARPAPTFEIPIPIT